MTTTAPVNEPPKVTLTPPPDPLPVTWARAIANDMAATLRRGWRSSTGKTSLVKPITGRDYRPPKQFESQLPTTEILWTVAYQYGMVEPIPALAVPTLLWFVTQPDFFNAVSRHNLTPHLPTVAEWLKHKPPRKGGGRPAALYLVKPNRHGRLNLRRNADYSPVEVTDVFLAGVEAASIWVPDEDDVMEFLAFFDCISVRAVEDALGVSTRS